MSSLRVLNFCIVVATASAMMFPLANPSRGQQPAKGDKIDTGVDPQNIRAALHLHAPFDGSADAKRFAKDGRILTADSLDRNSYTPGITRPGVHIAPGEGKHGDCLRFTDKSTRVLCFAGSEMPHSESNWSGTVSLWLRLNPDADLLPGYCDPIQITSRTWNDAAFFVDFDKDLPRDFRLGVFSDLSHWNPEKIDWDAWPIDKRPMVTVKNPPFTRDRWTHVAFTFENINPAEGEVSRSTLYLDGQPIGTLRQPMRFTWDAQRVAIMLGIEYIGDMDDLMIFTRALAPAEVKYIHDAEDAF
jgi:hypothetical protein